MAEDTANEPIGADKVQKEHEESVIDNTKERVKETKVLKKGTEFKSKAILAEKDHSLALDDQRREIATEIAQSVERRSVISSLIKVCLLYTSPSPRDRTRSRMPSSA